MDKSLEVRTLNGKFFREDFDVRAVIPNDMLPRSLTPILIEKAEGVYLEMKIVPGEVALEGYKWQLAEPSHIVYVKDNPDHPAYKKGKRIIQPGFININGPADYNGVLAIHNID